MLLTISTTHQPATDLGYLLGKNLARTQSFELSFGQAHVYYPEASEAPGKRGLVQPALKCRGPEYLRIIYGPGYTAPENIDRLRAR